MHPRPSLRHLAFLAGAVLSSAALTACAPDSSGAVGTASAGTAAAGPASSTSATGSAPSEAVAGTTGGSASAVPESLQFSARGVDGNTIDLGQYAGRPVVFWFWAPG